MKRKKKVVVTNTRVLVTMLPDAQPMRTLRGRGGDGSVVVTFKAPYMVVRG
jgi:hypothetical protein